MLRSVGRKKFCSADCKVEKHFAIEWVLRQVHFHLYTMEELFRMRSNQDHNIYYIKINIYLYMYNIYQDTHILYMYIRINVYIFVNIIICIYIRNNMYICIYCMRIYKCAQGHVYIYRYICIYYADMYNMYNIYIHV